MHRFTWLVPSLAAVAALVPSQALAAGGAEACGNVELLFVGECHFEFGGGCQAECQPLNFVAACEGQCQATLDASCDASCNASCNASCEANPGSFSCEASCRASCEADAHASCNGDQGCESYAEASCASECQAHCEVVAPSASCDAQCNASCEGSCQVDANLGCEVDCTAELQGGCEIDCEAPTGALFCDGQYIAVEDFPACIDYLVSNFSVDFEASASFDGTFSCSVGEGPSGGTPAFGATAGLLGLGLVLRRRRRANEKKPRSGAR